MACLCQSKGNGARLIAKFLRGQIDKNPNAVPMSCWKIFSSEKPFIEGTIDKINADEKKKTCLRHGKLLPQGGRYTILSCKEVCAGDGIVCFA